jgi:hypothetical protein
MVESPMVARALMLVLVAAALVAVLPSMLGQRAIRVVTVGDSVTYDADPGVRAALEATGSVVVDTRSIGGVGLLRPGVDGYLDEALAGDPDVVVVMLGGWDLGEILADPVAYAARLDAVADRLTADGAHVVWLSMPPTPPGEGIEDARRMANQLFEGLSVRRDDVTFVATGPLLGDGRGGFARFGDGIDGDRVQLRKVRGGGDDGHLCPGGAALIGGAVLDVVAQRFELESPSEPWWDGGWIRDLRYDDPPGACIANSDASG